LCSKRPKYRRSRGPFIGEGLPAGHRLLCTAQPWSVEPPIEVSSS
jgi:hypothetical protein